MWNALTYICHDICKINMGVTWSTKMIGPKALHRAPGLSNSSGCWLPILFVAFLSNPILKSAPAALVEFKARLKNRAKTNSCFVWRHCSGGWQLLTAVWLKSSKQCSFERKSTRGIGDQREQHEACVHHIATGTYSCNLLTIARILCGPCWISNLGCMHGTVWNGYSNGNYLVMTFVATLALPLAFPESATGNNKQLATKNRAQTYFDAKTTSWSSSRLTCLLKFPCTQVPTTLHC